LANIYATVWLQIYTIIRLRKKKLSVKLNRRLMQVMEERRQVEMVKCCKETQARFFHQTAGWWQSWCYIQ